MIDDSYIPAEIRNDSSRKVKKDDEIKSKKNPKSYRKSKNLLRVLQKEVSKKQEKQKEQDKQKTREDIASLRKTLEGKKLIENQNPKND